MTPSILHVIPAVASRYGGPSSALVGICRALDAAGASAVVATTDADGPGRLSVAIGQVQDWAGVRTVFFRRRFGEAYKWSAGMPHWLQAHVSEFDVVHVHAVFSHSSLAAGRACREAGVPYVVRPLGTLDPWSLGRHAVRKKVLFGLTVGRLLTGASAIHYTSDEERRLAEREMPWLPRAVVVPLGVDEEFFDGPRTDRERPRPYVLALSRLNPKKGIDLLIDAFHDLARDTLLADDWRLIVAGDGDAKYGTRLREAARRGPASGRIEFRGWVSGAERVALLRGAGLFALPSLQENFGIAVAEAMASGLPVLISPAVNLCDEIEGAGAGWIVPRDRDAWRAALASAMAAGPERLERGQRARQFAERYRWPAVASRLLSMYEELRGPAVQLIA